MNVVINFFNNPFFVVIGGISSIITIGLIVYGVYLWVKGIFPVLYRLGVGLSKAKIAIFADGEYVNLKNIIVASNIFVKRNIIQIKKGDMEAAYDSNIYLVYWKDWNDSIKKILNMKKPTTTLIIYAPSDEGKIEDPEILRDINAKRNSVLVNFRGRLLNDLLTSVITSNHKK